MMVNDSGLCTWAVTEGDVGNHFVSISVIDVVGNADTQKFNLTVKYQGESKAPVITSSPKRQAKTEEVYTYQIVATDSDGDTLTYRLITAPKGMTISENGLIQWLANETQIGLYEVVLEVSDPVRKNRSSKILDCSYCAKLV